ncbi:MAG TPA: TRAP transporter small permease [Dehalococcoidia bacterium]|nr:TRAP transporter small permease [Dehalococcoidia bacterium]
MRDKMENFDKFIRLLSNWLNWVAGVALVLMLVLIVVDIIAAKLFNWPVPGGIEVVGFLGVVVVAFAVAQTQVLHGHIEVEFLVSRLPAKAQRAIAGFTYACGMVLFMLLGWQSYEFGRTLQISGEVSMTQRIPFYPLVYGIAICSIVVFLVLLVQCVQVLGKAKK